jgi:streptogramin lyase
MTMRTFLLSQIRSKQYEGLDESRRGAMVMKRFTCHLPSFFPALVMCLLLVACTGSINPKAGIITEYVLPTPGSDPYTLVVGPDGALWFTEYFGNKIGRITTDGTITEFALPIPHGSPNSLVVGPDGAIWFTEYQGNKIGRITPKGVITEFALPTPESEQPSAIIAGPRGSLWFTEFFGNKIGRISPGGL